MPGFTRQGCSTRGDFHEMFNPGVCSRYWMSNDEEGDNTTKDSDEVLSAITDILHPLTFYGRRSCARRQEEQKIRPKNWTHILLLPTFRPHQLKVKVDGDKLIVQAIHKESKDENSILCKVKRAVPLPDSVDKSRIKARLVMGHMLKIEAPFLTKTSKQSEATDPPDHNDGDSTSEETDSDDGDEMETKCPMKDDDNEDDWKQGHNTEEKTTSLKSMIYPSKYGGKLPSHENTLSNEITEADITSVSSSGDEMQSLLASFEQVDTTEQASQEIEIDDEKLMCVRPSPTDDTLLKSAAIRVETTGDIDRDGVKYYEIRLDTSGFDPAEVSLSCRDGLLTVNAVKKVKKAGCFVHQESRKVLKIPSDVDVMLIKGSMADNGVLSVSAPYKPVTPDAVRDVPITVYKE